jgi:hypothetical protein
LGELHGLEKNFNIRAGQLITMGRWVAYGSGIAVLEIDEAGATRFGALGCVGGVGSSGRAEREPGVSLPGFGGARTVSADFPAVLSPAERN